MSGRWANYEAVATSTEFEALHAGLTVRMIETPRSSIKMCRSNEAVSTVISRNVEGYDHIPVLTANSPDANAIVGMLHADSFRNGPVCGEPVAKHMLALSEDHLIGADTSIRDFIKEADAKPCRLVVSGSGFTGLVTLSDLQRLPVRAALFALVTGFEITMLEAIRRRFPEDVTWLAFLSPGRREKLMESVQLSKKADGYVDTLLFTQFCDKADVVRKAFKFSRAPSDLKKDLYALQSLRNDLAHANEYAASPSDAKRVCAVVNNLLVLVKELATAE